MAQMSNKNRRWLSGFFAAFSGLMPSFLPVAGRVCTGTCGNCSGSCVGGVVAGLGIVGMYFYKKISRKTIPACFNEVDRHEK